MNPILKQAITPIMGIKCWGLVAGGGNGSTLTLHCGERVRRKAQIPNWRISEQVQLFQGEICIFVRGCAWRLEDRESIVCVWNNTEQMIEKAMQVLVGKSISTIQITNWACDLWIEFDSRYILRLFCDQGIGNNSIDNYAIRIPSRWIVVGPNSEVSQEDTSVAL